MRPGVTTIRSDNPPPRSAPTDTGVWFVAGLADKGAEEPILITSLTRFTDLFGERQSYSILYDAVETFFREGGAKVYISRVLGPAATPAFVVLDDAGAADTLRVEANSAGAWGNALNVAITAGDVGGEFKIVISHDTEGTLETSPSLADKTAAFAWAEDSDYVNLVDQASALDPEVVAATSLAGGADDRASVTDAHWLEALDRFTRDLGPGQVSYPGRTTSTAYQQLLEHADSNNRRALLDGADTSNDSTLKAAAGALKDRDDAKYGALFAPWIVVPGVTRGTTREVPYSAVQAGLIARSDGLGNSPNVPAAGENGQSQFALSVKNTWTDTQREELNAAGVNVARTLYGGVRTYGYRTLVDANDDDNWVPLSNSRLFMAIVAKGESVAERFVFDQIDGRGRKLAEYKGSLIGEVCLPYYEVDALYGSTPEEAFNVDVGAQVNTPESLADRKIKAVIAVRMSPFAEEVILEIVKVATEEAVA